VAQVRSSGSRLDVDAVAHRHADVASALEPGRGVTNLRACPDGQPLDRTADRMVNPPGSSRPPDATGPSRSRPDPHHHRRRPIPDDLRAALNAINNTSVPH
jgi:hypothetical protein